MNISGPGPHGLVPRQSNPEVLDMTGHADLVRVLSNAWELPYAGVKHMDGLAIWKTTAQSSVMKVPTGTDQLLIIPLTGECLLQVQGSSENSEPVSSLKDQARSSDETQKEHH